MKNLIYTFLFALLFVACDKNDNDIDVMSVDPIEEEITSISNDFDISSLDIDGLISRLTSSTAKNNKKVGLNANKSSIVGESYISLYTGVVDGNLFEIAFDDTQTFCVPSGSGLNYLTLFYNADGNTEVKIGGVDSEIIAATVEGIGFLFELDINQGVRINGSTKVVTQAQEGTPNNVFTF